MKRLISVKNYPKASIVHWLTFLIPSIIGVFLFIAPISIDGNITIPIAFFAATLKAAIGQNLTAIITGIVTITGLATMITKLFTPRIVLDHPLLVNLFDSSRLWCSLRLAGALFIILSFFQIGPEAIWSKTTGGMVLNELLPSLFAIFVFSGIFLPLLMNFGLLELLGTLMTRVMRPIFNLPGRSAVNCMASWLGDGSVGILMTSKQYELSYYTQREAAVIGTTFSIVSITFSLVVIAQVGLEHLFGPFYLTICLAGLTAALIVPRIPPLSKKKDIFICGRPYDGDEEVIPEGNNAFTWGITLALTKASRIKNPLYFLKDGGRNAIEMLFALLPVVMGIGTIALIIAEYTPLFNYLGLPFIPLLELLHIPEAKAASTTIMVGFTDMFIPTILAASINSELTRFVIAALSLTQLIYLSEVGALLLGSKIPITLIDIFVIFILRTLVTLPVIAGMAHIIF